MLVIVMILLGVYVIKKLCNYREYKKYKAGYDLIRTYIFEKYDRLRFDKFIQTPVSTIEVEYNVNIMGCQRGKQCVVV